MPFGRALMLASCIVAASPAAAQLPTPAPPGPYVVDLRATTVAFPTDVSFFPPTPTGTVIPARGFGWDVGGHVYLFRFGPSRLGVGASLVRASRTTSPPPPTPPPAGSTTPPRPRTIPDVEATFTAIAPQVSFNFGSADGWSYLSAGMGFAEVNTATSEIPMSRTIESGRLSSINIGGGARWFRSRHLAFVFDVRFHLISAKERALPLRSTPRTMLLSASGGIGLR